ncbi:unnamed protein product, partial [Meganyctiphanes norvegica]
MAPQKCFHCDKLYTQKSHLIMHTRIHSGEKPYQWGQCEKFYKEKQSIEIHQKDNGSTVQQKQMDSKISDYYSLSESKNELKHIGIKTNEIDDLNELKIEIKEENIY